MNQSNKADEVTRRIFETAQAHRETVDLDIKPQSIVVRLCARCGKPSGGGDLCPACELPLEKGLQRMRDTERYLLGETCIDCGGVKATETTPNWVYDEKDICCCEGTS